jgi:hypothetical protein
MFNQQGFATLILTNDIICEIHLNSEKLVLHFFVKLLYLPHNNKTT